MPYIRHERGLKIRRFTLAFSYFERTMLNHFMLAASNINGFESNACNLNLERGYFFLNKEGNKFGFLVCLTFVVVMLFNIYFL